MPTTNLPARQNNKLQPAKKESKPVAKFQEEIDHAWELYRQQLQRNFELMQIITEMQKVIGQQTAFTIPKLQPIEAPMPAPVEAVQKKEEPLLEALETLPLQRCKKLYKIYNILDGSVKRQDAAQSHLEMLFALQQLEEVYPERLYMHMAVPDSTGYRYSRGLQAIGLVKYYRGKLMLSKAGVLLMTAPLETGDDCKKLIEDLKEAGIAIHTLDRLSVPRWFDEEGKKL